MARATSARRENRIRRIVREGLIHLNDTSPLDEPRTWFRNGERGNLHATSRCYKYQGTGSSVILSTRDASTKQTCDDCCSIDDLLGRDIGGAVNAAADVASSVAWVEQALESPANTAKLGQAIRLLADAQQTLERISEGPRDLVADSLRALEERIGSARARLTAASSTLQETLVPWAAAALTLRSGGELLPGQAEDDVALFGRVPVTSTTRYEHQLPRIYHRWCHLRQSGRADATEGALKRLEESALTDVTQLRFAGGGAPAGENVLEWAQAAWRQELRTRLEERLLPAWEQVFCRHLAKRDLRLVGFPKVIRTDETRSILAAYPHVQTASRLSLVLVPEVVAEFILATEKNWRGEPVVTGPCDPDLLEVVGALWEPNDPSSAYVQLADAVAAASAL